MPEDPRPAGGSDGDSTIPATSSLAPAMDGPGPSSFPGSSNVGAQVPDPAIDAPSDETPTGNDITEDAGGAAKGKTGKKKARRGGASEGESHQPVRRSARKAKRV